MDNLALDKTNKKELIFYLSIAYIFGVFVRLLLFNNITGVEEYWFDGRPLPIYSDDAGFYGYYAKEILNGANFAFTGDYVLAYIIAYTSLLTTIHIDWIMFLLPAFLASLVVIPIIMMGYILNRTQFSFFVAIIGVVGINYYTRSYLGYMDTDGINMFLIYSLVASIVVVIYKKDLRFSIISIISLLFFLGFYHSSKSLIGGVLVGYLVIGMIFYFKEKIIYQLFIILGLSFVIGLKFGVLISLAISSTILLFFIKGNYKIIPLQLYVGLIFLSIFGVLFLVDLSSIYSRVLDYANIGAVVSIGEFKIMNVLSTVSETQQRGIFDIYNGFIGVKYYVIVATMGYFLLVYKHREFIFFLPLLILGYLSFKIGIRFTMYSSFVLALGFVYILYYFKENIIIYIGVVSAISLMFINILGINSYIKPKYFLNEDIKLLNELKIDKSAMMVSWWDYGWPLWYYTGNRNTYIDNGLNTHGGTLFVSKMLLSPPKEAYKLAKIISTNNRELYILKSQESIDKMANKIDKTRDTYIMLHRNMLSTLKSIAKFADRDLTTGKLIQNRTFALLSNIIKKDKNRLYTTNFIINIDKGIIRRDKKSGRLNQIIVIKNKKIEFSKIYDSNSDKNIIIVDNRAIYIDNKTLNSLFVSKFLLNKRGKYFKEVIELKNIKILKLN
ncbi:Oligosaccharyltransferase PglB [hydrothermal vent metagenome]|uniref:Oligosaccharyltransferase PglB n=1 Tax=hydrothermal vent metagenome TaxID=652676 RepID=A0A1W1EKP0_9ZZZZ